MSGINPIGAMAVSSLISRVVGAFGEYQAGQEQSDAYKEQAKWQERQTEEEARRLARQQQEVEALARARAAAGGTTGGGSKALVRDRISQQHQSEMDWLRRTGSRSADVLRKNAKSARRAGTIGAIGQLGQAGMGGYRMFRNTAPTPKGD